MGNSLTIYLRTETTYIGHSSTPVDDVMVADLVGLYSEPMISSIALEHRN